jgi:hypothetical protein
MERISTQEEGVSATSDIGTIELICMVSLMSAVTASMANQHSMPKHAKRWLAVACSRSISRTHHVSGEKGLLPRPISPSRVSFDCNTAEIT